MRTNRKSGDCGCGCGGDCASGARAMRRIAANLATTHARRETHNGRDHIVVPVVMARSDVVMNGALVPEEEFFPSGWNGVPVTVNHPTDAAAGGNISAAASPRVWDEWTVGRIFGAHVRDGALRAEAWVDVDRAEALSPGLVAMLESGEPVEVSTGFYSRDERKTGRVNGRSYTHVARDLVPDHLALLPGEIGACSWEDGCGVRANRSVIMKVNEALEVLKRHLGLSANSEEPGDKSGERSERTNERGSDDDHRMMVADLLSDDRTPFVPDDEEGLRYMSRETLRKVRDQYLRSEEKKGRRNVASEGDPSLSDTERKAGTESQAGDGGGVDIAALTKSIAEQVTGQIGELVANQVAQVKEQLSKELLTNDDREALARAAKVNAEVRQGLIDRIVANSEMSEEQVKEWPTSQLEVVANGLRPQSDYAGRASTVHINRDDDEAAGMAMPSLDEAIRAQRETKREVH